MKIDQVTWPVAGHVRPWEHPGFSWALGALVAIAHMVAAIALNDSVGALYEDGREFNDVAAGLATQFDYGPPEAFRPPGWPMLLAVFYRVFGVHPSVGLALNAVLAGIAVVALIRLGERLGLSRLQACVAGLAYGLFPWVLVIGAALYAETLFNLLTICLCLMIVEFREQRPNPWLWILPGLIAAYATLVRPVLAFWLPVALLFALGRKLDWRAALGMALGIAVVFGIWTGRNFERLDSFVPLTTAGGLTLALANNDLAGAAQAREGLPAVALDSEVETDRTYREFAQNWIKEHPGEFAKRVPERIVRTLDPVTRLNKGVFSTPPIRWSVRILWIAMLAVVGLGLVKNHRGRWLVPLSLAVVGTLPVALFGGGFRFLIPALPFLALWFVAGASLALKRFRPVNIEV